MFTNNNCFFSNKRPRCCMFTLWAIYFGHMALLIDLWRLHSVASFKSVSKTRCTYFGIFWVRLRLKDITKNIFHKVHHQFFGGFLVTFLVLALFLQWRPIQMRVFHSNENGLFCTQPPTVAPLSWWKERGKQEALIWMKNSHVNRTLQ